MASGKRHGGTKRTAAPRARRARARSADSESPSDGEGAAIDGELVDEDAAPAKADADGDGDGDGAAGDDDDSLVADLAGADDGEVTVADSDLAQLVRGSAADAKAAREPSLARRDPLSAYVQELRRYPLLDRDTEHELAVRLVEQGDTTAARRLIEANLRLVVKIAYEYRRAHRNLLDLVQEGNIGLMQAVRKYDPYRGVKLSSYAAWWIRAYILKFILNNWRLVKIGTTQAQRKLFFNLRKEKERLEQLGFEPDHALLAQNLQVSEQDVIEMEKRLMAPEASLDAPIGGDDDDGTRTRLDSMRSAEQTRPDVQVAEQEFHSLLREKLASFASTLKGREETIFRDRWLTDSPLTLQEIGDKYGISRERARQLEKRMLTRLRGYLEHELGSAVDIEAMIRE